MKTATKKKLFPLGQVVATPGALHLLAEAGARALDILERHQRGDWGELVPEDCSVNNDAVKLGGSILSAVSVPLSTTC